MKNALRIACWQNGKITFATMFYIRNILSLISSVRDVNLKSRIDGQLICHLFIPKFNYCQLAENLLLELNE